METFQVMARRPVYRHGQLLLEQDFTDEQQFHTEARERHARWAHGFGVVRGLEVVRDGDLSITVSPGYAVDRGGREIELAEPATLALGPATAGGPAWVTIGYRTQWPDGRDDGNRMECVARLGVGPQIEPDDIRLARLRFDGRSRLAPDPIEAGERDDLLSRLTPGSVTPEALAPQLRAGWISMAFHPSDLPGDAKDYQPPFRVGATEAKVHEEIDNQPNTLGAAGTMALLLPPGLRQIRRVRVAGAANEKGLTATLVRGGFDPKAMKHLREEILVIEVRQKGGYDVTADVPDAQRGLEDQARTLAIDVRSQGYATISLVALEVTY